MKRFLSVTALAATMTVGAGAAQAQDLLAWWSFNNSHNSNQGDGLHSGSDFYHTTIPGPAFDDGIWTGPTDNTVASGVPGDLMLPVYDAFFAPAQPGALVDTTGIDNAPGTTAGRTAVGNAFLNGQFGAHIDVSNLVGDNNGTPNSGQQWGSFSGTGLNRPGGSFGGGSLVMTGDANNGSYFDVVADLSDYVDIEVSWANRGTGTGYNSRAVAVSTDGVNFTPIYGDAGTLSSTWTAEIADAGSLLDNASNAIFRFTVDGATSNNGNNRFDNIVLSGTFQEGTPEIPVPAAAWMGLVGLGGLAARRLRKA